MKQLDDFQLMRKIGSGGMAEVWEAHQAGPEGFQKRFAIKLIHPHFAEEEDFLHMFLDEGRLAAQLTHPNICQLFKLGQSGQIYYIAMEYIDGTDVDTLMKKSRKREVSIPYAHCIQVVLEVCEALEYAHNSKDLQNEAMHLVHRDISPKNIMLTQNGHVKVVDFGIAKAANQLHQTRPGVLRGKCSYMSPEQVDNKALDRRSDLFSVGIVLWELTTGQQLFHGETELPILLKISTGDYPSPSHFREDYPPALERIVMKALAYDRDKRYQNCAALQEDLEEFLVSHRMVASPRRLSRYIKALLEGLPFPQVSDSSLPTFPSPERKHTPIHVSVADSLRQQELGEHNTPIAVSNLLVSSDTHPSPSEEDTQEQEALHSEAKAVTAALTSSFVPSFAPTPLPDPEAVPLRILVVDDQAEVLNSLRMMLSVYGYEVDVAENGKEAIDKVKTSSFDLCLLDLEMPVMDGREALKHIKVIRPSLPCVIQTANDSFQTAAEMGRLGAATYVVKPVKRKELLRVVKEAATYRPQGEDLERTIQLVYPTHIAELRQRYLKSTKSMDLRHRHQQQSVQFEALLSWCGTLAMAAYQHDQSIVAEQYLFAEPLQRLKLTPKQWLDLIERIGSGYRITQRSFFSRHLRDFLSPQSWQLSNEQIQAAEQMLDRLNPLLGEFESFEEVPTLRAIYALAHYHEEMWKDDAFLNEEELTQLNRVIDPILTLLYQQLYPLIDFQLFQVDAIATAPQGTQHNLRLYRGLTPEHQKIVLPQALELHTLYLFSPTQQSMFPLTPFALPPHVDNASTERLAIPLQLSLSGRLHYRAYPSGQLQRLDAQTQTKIQEQLQGLWSRSTAPS